MAPFSRCSPYITHAVHYMSCREQTCSLPACKLFGPRYPLIHTPHIALLESLLTYIAQNRSSPASTSSTPGPRGPAGSPSLPSCSSSASCATRCGSTCGWTTRGPGSGGSCGSRGRSWPSRFGHWSGSTSYVSFPKPFHFASPWDWVAAVDAFVFLFDGCYGNTTPPWMSA